MIKGFGASAILAVLAVSPSAANDFALILASQPNDLKAIEYSQSLVARGAFRSLDDFSFLRSSNGWLAVSLGVFDKAQCENRLADAKTRPGVPKDAYCSPTQRFTEKLAFVAGRLQTSSLNNSSATSNAAPPTPMAASPAAERRSWRTLSPEFTRCADIALRRSNSSVASLMQQRIEADDPRLSPIMKFCEGVTSMVARKDFECDLRTTSGATIRTRCYEEFVYVEPNGAKIPLSFDDVVNRRLANQTVSLLQTERSDAVDRRRALEQQKREEERQIAEQRAAEARQREAEEQARRIENENAMRAKEAERQAELKRIAAEAAAKAAPFKIGLLYQNDGVGSCEGSRISVCASEAEYKLLCERAKQITKNGLTFTIYNASEDVKAAFAQGIDDIKLTVSPERVHCGVTMSGSGSFNGAPIQKTVTGRVYQFLIGDNGDVLVNSISTSFNSRYKDETSSLKWGEEDRARAAAEAAAPIVKVDNQGLIRGQRIFESSSSHYYSCDGVVSPVFRSAVYALTSAVSKTMNVPAPQETLCAVSQGKPGSIGGTMIKVDMYINEFSMQSCIYRNSCNDFRSVMLFPSKKGDILLNVFITNAATRQMKQVCMNMKGAILSEQGCASVN